MNKVGQLLPDECRFCHLAIERSTRQARDEDAMSSYRESNRRLRQKKGTPSFKLTAARWTENRWIVCCARASQVKHSSNNWFCYQSRLISSIHAFRNFEMLDLFPSTCLASDVVEWAKKYANLKKNLEHVFSNVNSADQFVTTHTDTHEWE